MSDAVEVDVSVRDIMWSVPGRGGGEEGVRRYGSYMRWSHGAGSMA